VYFCIYYTKNKKNVNRKMKNNSKIDVSAPLCGLAGEKSDSLIGHVR